jgi:hypothetical protein
MLFNVLKNICSQIEILDVTTYNISNEALSSDNLPNENREIFK